MNTSTEVQPGPGVIGTTSGQALLGRVARLLIATLLSAAVAAIGSTGSIARCFDGPLEGGPISTGGFDAAQFQGSCIRAVMGPSDSLFLILIFVALVAVAMAARSADSRRAAQTLRRASATVVLVAAGAMIWALAAFSAFPPEVTPGIQESSYRLTPFATVTVSIIPSNPVSPTELSDQGD